MHLSRVRSLSLQQPKYLATMVVVDHAVLDALRRRSPDEGRELALRYHLRMVLSALPALRAEHPDYFEDEEDGSS